jgi:PAS domain S-box-containing protein
MQRGMLDAASLQHLLYQALDDSDDLVVILEQINDTPEGLIVEAVNDAFCRVSGLAFKDVVGRPFIALAARDAVPESWSAVLKAARDQMSFRSELLCTRPAGSPFWLGLHIMSAAWSGHPYSVVLGRDITSALREKQQHVAIQGLLAKVFASVGAAVAIIEEHGIIVMTNPALDSLLGYPPGGLVGKASLDVVVPADRTAAVEARQRQIANGQSYMLQATLLHADGSRVSVELTSILVERDDLKRFRILTVMPITTDGARPPVSVHIAGKIKLIGLEDIKSALGSRWPAVAARAMAVAEHIVKRHCGRRDTWSRTTDSAIVICFADTTEEEASLRATTIARDIRARLIGEGEKPGAATVSAITAAVELPDQGGRTLDMLADALSQRLSARLAEFETRARDTLGQAMRSVTCDLTAVRGRGPREVVGHFATLPNALEDRVRNALAVLPGPEREGFEFDRLVLGAAAEHLIERLAAGNSAPILVPFDFEAFLDRHRMERYLATCRAVDGRLQRNLILVLSNLPHGVPRSRVQECVMRLRPLCQMVAFEAEGLEIPAVELSVLNGSVLVLREADLCRWEADELAKLESLIGLARTQRTRVLVRLVSNFDSARRLLKLGVDLISITNDAGGNDPSRSGTGLADS